MEAHQPMKNHLVSVYLRPDGAIGHVQSTNGDAWPGDVVETGPDGVALALTRIDLELEPTADEIKNGVNGRPKPRRAGVLFREELEHVGGVIRYRAGKGDGGAIRIRAVVEISGPPASAVS